ncbi:hypothetical protein [Halanaeroarchaeum sulfurireducens]|nr:hypothetical protein [Halanaeroarchaeum sulfurireducens]
MSGIDGAGPADVASRARMVVDLVKSIVPPRTSRNFAIGYRNPGMTKTGALFGVVGSGGRHGEEE